MTKFNRRHVHFVVGLAFVAFALLVLLLAVSSPATVASAQGCSANSFSMDPVPPGEGYALGTHVVLRGSSNCGTVKFNIKNLDTGWNTDKAETGQSSQTEVWKTEETNTGTFEVCFLARGDGGWENASKMCRTVYVKGGQGPTAGPVAISQFSVTPSTIVEGQSFSMVGMGHGPNGIRATKFTVDSQDWNESSNGTNRADWSPGTGDHTICFLVTSGDWNNSDQTARQCVSVTVLAKGNPVPPPVVVQPKTPDTGGGGGTTGGGSSDSIAYGSHPELRESHGGIFTHIYCQLKGHPAPSSDPSDGDTFWRCGDGYIVDFEEGCKIAYGANYTAFVDHSYTPLKFAWRCKVAGSSGGTVNPPPKKETPVPPVVPPSGTCGSAPTPQFTPGMRGVVKEGEPEWISDRGSFVKADNANHIGDLYAGDQFTVREGPVCGRGISGRTWFYRMDADNGKSGWIAEGYSDYWIRPISGSSVTPPKKEAQTESRAVPFAKWGISYVLIFDYGTCQILNGSEIIAQEIERFDQWVKGANLSQEIAYLNIDGELDKFREEVESTANSVAQAHSRSCTWYYRVGKNTMDTSGLGNVIYGFAIGYYHRLPGLAAHIYADFKQIERDGLAHRIRDYRDDAMQIDLGNAIADAMAGEGRSLNSQLVEDMAWKVDLQ